MKKIGFESFFAFTMSRLALLAVGWFAQAWPLDPARPLAITDKGYWASPFRLLDIWIRSDSNYFMSIIAQGYSVRGNLREVQSNLAFFPLYPALLKPLTSFIFYTTHNSDLALFACVAVSNLCLFGAVVLLYKLALHEFGDHSIARRTIWYLLLFPTSFFLSAFYAEGLFLFLSLAAFYALIKKKWAITALLGCLLALTKPMGILFLAVLVLAYDWTQPKFKEIVWFTLIPISMAAFFIKGYNISGELFAPIIAHMAWGKHLSWPWETFFNDAWGNPSYLQFERLLVIGFLILLPIMIKKLPKHYTFYSGFLMLPNLISGALMGFGRHLGLNFPIMLVLALIITNKQVSLIVAAIFATAQLIIMVVWCQYYQIW